MGDDWHDEEVREYLYLDDRVKMPKQPYFNRRRRNVKDPVEFSISAAEEAKKHLHKIGLWTAASLAPYPLSHIVKEIKDGDLERARRTLVSFCPLGFIERKLINTWSPITAFRDRSLVFQEALFAHQNAKYALSIYTLNPQIEGVISDWIAGLEGQNLETQFSKKIDQFYALLKNIPQRGFYLEKTIESTYEFLKDGQPTQSFKNWLDKIDPSFPGRHAVAHGKYSNDMFTEENSIKLFLMLDTICDFMMIYEHSVLGRDFSRSSPGS